MNILELKNCIKKYNNKVVLDDVSIDVEEGKVTTIIGHSGSGKSTILRLCVLLERMDKGELIFNNKKICSIVNDSIKYISDFELVKLRHDLGLVFQNFNLFPHFTVLNNLIDAPIIVKKVNKNDAIEKAKEILNEVGLIDKINDYPQQLSGGQKQRVAIARALMMDPKIIFFDEPTSALDPELTREVLRTLKILASKNRTMVIVTHEMEFARNISDKIYFLLNGKIADSGDSEYIFSKSNNEGTRKFLDSYKN